MNETSHSCVCFFIIITFFSLNQLCFDAMILCINPSDIAVMNRRIVKMSTQMEMEIVKDKSIL